ncbi:FAD-dependent monooxygenase [Streptomyces sp. NPDC059454]|uniref:FAD-dependent monooxygenase n=1 Tax=Streptomyces sp. NPDC059454 TaxID=3346836 RepID=UPI0036B99298
MDRIPLRRDSGRLRAHPLPLGARGLDTGTGDAASPGWKLATTSHGHAPDGLLDTCAGERRPVGAQALDGRDGRDGRTRSAVPPSSGEDRPNPRAPR